MNGYLSQIAARAGGLIAPHSLVPVGQSAGVYTPRIADTGNDNPAPPTEAVTRSVIHENLEPELLEQPQKVPEQKAEMQPAIRYLARYVERPPVSVQQKRIYTQESVAGSIAPTPFKKTVTHIPLVKEVIKDSAKEHDTMNSVLNPLEDSDRNIRPPMLVLRPATREKAMHQNIEPAKPHVDIPAIGQRQSPAALQPPITVLTPRSSTGAPVALARKAAPQQVTIGRITVEIVPPAPVQTVSRSKPRSAGPPIPAPGNDEIHKLSFGFGQL